MRSAPRVRMDDARDGELVRVAAYTGLRRGELIALRWHNIDFAAHKLTVRLPPLRFPI